MEKYKDADEGDVEAEVNEGQSSEIDSVLDVDEAKENVAWRQMLSYLFALLSGPMSWVQNVNTFKRWLSIIAPRFSAL
jgi:hypothetical protein